ncbi:SDR family NAD(P)-dependent oxidoreductase [Sphingomonas jatrophae]|uniref:Meso-butanediol dehydrogenase / (S,S)-butanediol dehydrogenase / diacetyl reductase n=1 Tax=Sphingomonas jatrophae TaxID=1166337 RepID=A0A1I6KGT3_9SPHN|nr:SDR family oxidoreductase [Sphingomonas jatrophae]SFR90080.1 meso-butanediol dehydrogenase / (S,S)-butanediol dehydrogenase / diacetyl reductase [Sphingomonas jatrophae]
MAGFAGKSVVVLGASSPIGIGAAVARRFAAEGARVMVAARRRPGLEALAADISGEAFVCDTTDHDTVGALAAAAVERFGRLNVAVNCVAAGSYGPLSQIDPASTLPAVMTNFVGGLYFIKHMGNAMEPDGAIIMTSSSSVTNNSAGLGVYASTKAAINHAIKVAAVEYMAKRLRINAIEMSLVLTESTPRDAFTPEAIEAFARATPLGRLATPEDCAEAYLFAAGAFTTGRIIDISGRGTLVKATMG